MQRMFLASVTTALAAVCAPVAVHAQGQQPTFATTKVTDNVYYFRYQGHQSMFIVTPAGVIATDPISDRRRGEPNRAVRAHGPRTLHLLQGRHPCVCDGDAEYQP